MLLNVNTMPRHFHPTRYPRFAGMGAGMAATAADWDRLCARSQLPTTDPNYRSAPNACANAAAAHAAERAAASPPPQANSPATPGGAPPQTQAPPPPPASGGSVPASQFNALRSQLEQAQAALVAMTADRDLYKGKLENTRTAVTARNQSTNAQIADLQSQLDAKATALTAMTADRDLYKGKLENTRAAITVKNQTTAAQIRELTDQAAAARADAEQARTNTGAQQARILSAALDETGNRAEAAQGFTTGDTRPAASAAPIVITQPSGGASPGGSSTMVIVGAAAAAALLFASAGKRKRGRRR